MKYLKIHIRSGDLKKGEHQMMYPDVYDAQEVEQVKIGPILYPNEIGKGAEEEDCVICFSDDIIANDYISLSGGEITELSAIDVDTYMTTRWEGRNDCNEKVIDIDRLLAIQVKKSLAIKLTAEDDCGGLADADRDAWLDLVMTHVIEPRLGDGLVFVRDYPASQAALARLRSGNPPVAARFEVYLNGVELANGFHELTDAVEQRQRFENELKRRRQTGAETVQADERFLSALNAGLPECAGVALGLDRLLMLASGSECVQDVIAFPFDTA